MGGKAKIVCSKDGKEFFPFRICEWDSENELQPFPGHELKGFKTLSGCETFLQKQGYTGENIEVEYQ